MNAKATQLSGTNNFAATIKKTVCAMVMERPRSYDELSEATDSPIKSLHVMVHRWVKDGLLTRLNQGTHAVLIDRGPLL